MNWKKTMQIYKRRLKKIGKLVNNLFPSNEPEPSGVCIYELSKPDRLFETGLRKWFSLTELEVIHAKYGITARVFLPDNGREPLDVKEWNKEG